MQRGCLGKVWGVGDSCLHERHTDWQAPASNSNSSVPTAAAHLCLVLYSLGHPGWSARQNWHSAALKGGNIGSWVFNAWTLKVAPCRSLVLSPKAATSSYMTLGFSSPIWALILAILKCAVAKQGSFHVSYHVGQRGGHRSGQSRPSSCCLQELTA